MFRIIIIIIFIIGCNKEESASNSEIEKIDPSIIVNDVSKTFGDEDFEIDISSTSSGSLTFNIENQQIAQVENGVLSILSAGTTTITVVQVADENYKSGSVSFLLTVSVSNIWRGRDVYFTKGTNDDWNDKAFQDSISSSTILTRANKQSIFNILSEQSYSETSPENTEWAIGNIDDIENLNFCKFSCLAQGRPNRLINTPLVLHLIEENIYLSIVLTYWGGGQTNDPGAITYYRSTPVGYIDSDNDGVTDGFDICPESTSNMVTIFGCDL